MTPIIIGAFILLLYFAFLWKYDKELQKESDYLDKREIAISEKAAWLAKWEKELLNIEKNNVESGK